MSKREKLRQKLRNPSNDADMRDVQTLLERFGFVLARTRGSHYIFEYDDGEQSKQIIFPLHGRKVKRIYIQEVVQALDELFPPENVKPEETSDGEDD